MIRVREWECAHIDVRPLCNQRVPFLRYRAGWLRFNFDGRGCLTMRGELHGCLFAHDQRVVNVARVKYTRWRATCRCGAAPYHLLVTLDGLVGCRTCLPLLPSACWTQAKPYRRSKAALMAALTGPDPRAQRWALWALELGPLNHHIPKRANPTARQRMYPDPWDEEVMELRLLLTGKWPHE